MPEAHRYPLGSLELLALPAFQDNYIWLLANAAGECLVVDPGDAAPVLRACASGLRPVAMLLTHHHADHIGGATEVLAAHPMPCYGPADPRMPPASRPVHDGDTVEVAPLGLAFRVIEVPGHTRSHIAFHGGGLLFCGDTLFSLGCGRLFEGSPAQMLDSLDRLAALPDETLVCCAHEYTLANGRFAQAAEPENPAREQHLARVQASRDRGKPSLPVALRVERDANPFLRVQAAGLRETLAARLGHPPADRLEAFTALRAWKDGFSA